MSTKRAVLQTLHDEPYLSFSEIERRLGSDSQDLTFQISLLMDDGYVVKDTQGKYRITAPGEQKLRRLRISSTIGFDIRRS